MVIILLVIGGTSWFLIKRTSTPPLTEIEISPGENQYLLQEGILLEFGPNPVSNKLTMFYATVAHICETKDELLLEKIEILDENKKQIKLFQVDKNLEAIGKELKEFRALEKRELTKLQEKLGTTTVPREWYPLEEKNLVLLGLLSEEIRKKSFTTGYFTIDLTQLKESLQWGDKILITVKLYLKHNGSPVILDKPITIKYQR